MTSSPGTWHCLLLLFIETIVKTIYINVNDYRCIKWQCSNVYHGKVDVLTILPLDLNGPLGTWHRYTLSISVFLHLQGLLPHSILGVHAMEELEPKPYATISC
uniref:Putative secreted protein n=1 Tax=Ixodes ricinus TaxID=34613 RepID=A0A6B0UFE6_IXORI